MKILLLDDDYILFEQLKCLMELDKSWSLVSINEVNYDKIDFVIVDIFNEKYNQILQKVLDINPKIRTLTVSDKLSSNFPKGCEYCNSTYNRIRLIKPIKLKLLFDTIKDFDNIPSCPLLNAFSDLENLIPIIIKQFKNLFYDKELQTVLSTSSTESKEHTMQILSLLTLLDENKIQYTLLDDSRIKIHINS